ncbi:MAG: hypothetical protein KFB96_25015 [Thiocapsa sp.]|uniref:hypothetical protein n=1 Tax=Thiocapsa sp. TaxID=2024551 RepID=UPI001BD07DF4|nr:hypothetical protein [Thiocapsa sp.]QVL48768.1 MAG: hypothetical protein KFB96_25015 [Thiocapsa sp.]
MRIACNVDLSPEDLKVAQLRGAAMLDRWNDGSIEAESLLKRERSWCLDASWPARPGDPGCPRQPLRLLYARPA